MRFPSPLTCVPCHRQDAPTESNSGRRLRVFAEAQEFQGDHHVPDLHAHDRENGNEHANFGHVESKPNCARHDADICRVTAIPETASHPGEWTHTQGDGYDPQKQN